MPVDLLFQGSLKTRRNTSLPLVSFVFPGHLPLPLRFVLHYTCHIILSHLRVACYIPLEVLVGNIWMTSVCKAQRVYIVGSCVCAYIYICKEYVMGSVY